MSRSARAYIVFTAAAGIALLGFSFARWTGASPERFIAFLTLAILCSIWKVSLPGVTSTLSVNYIFVLIAASLCDFPQTVLIGSLSATAQCIFRAKARPRTIHIVFNAGSAVLSSAACYLVCHLALTRPALASTPVLFFLTASAYFWTNSASVCGIIALTENKSFARVFHESFLWTAPQYLFGATVAAAFSAIASRFGWDWALLIIPAMFVVYGSYRLYLRRFEEERRHAREMSELHLRTIEALAVAIDAKDETTHDHLRRVQVYALAIGEELGLTGGERQALQAAALLHDIGKLAVPEYILSKPGRLTPEEFERIKIHPTVGAEILERVRFPYPVVPIVAAHHEKWDGSGYPNGLARDAIPIGARILSAVDCFDALASDRQYRRALPLDEAIKKIVDQSGTSFDPRVVEVLSRRYRELEATAQSTHIETTKLSKDIKSSRGAAPDAGFVETVATTVEATPNFVVSIAAARHEFQVLYELIGALGASLDLDGALSLIAARLTSLIPYDCIAIYIVENGMLVPRHVAGTDSALFSSIRIPMGEGVSGFVAETRKAVVNGNPSVEPGYLHNPAKFSVLLSVTSAPLIGSSGLIGVLSLYSRAKDSFTADHARLLNAVSAKLAVAIERASEFSREHESLAIDPVTRVANARALFVHLESQLSRSLRTRDPFSVLVLEIRAQKGALNQVRGSVAQALKHACREYDLVAELSAGEFVIVLPGADRNGSSTKLDELVRVAGENAPAYAGRATWPMDGSDAEELLAAADRDLYARKQAIEVRRETPVCA